ncbi:MAG: hypothetical protein U1E61_10620 [Bradyrhizobium sp.]
MNVIRRSIATLVSFASTRSRFSDALRLICEADLVRVNGGGGKLGLSGGSSDRQELFTSG